MVFRKRSMVEGVTVMQSDQIQSNALMNSVPSQAKQISETNSSSRLDLDFYRNYYHDLSNMTDEELKQHWENFGSHEGRFPNKNLYIQSAPEMQFSFDSDFYLSFYPDLSSANITSHDDAKWHWWTAGKKEKRFRTAAEWVKGQKKSQLLFNPSDVDYSKVLKENAELAVTAIDIIEMSLGRIDKPIKIQSTAEATAVFYKNIGLKAYSQYQESKDSYKLDATRKACRISSHFHPSNEVLELLAKTYFDTHDYRTAQAVYESAYEISNKLSNNAFVSLLTCYERMTKIKCALNLIERYKGDNPSESIGLELIDNLCQKLYLDNLGEVQVLGTLDKRDKLISLTEQYANQIYDAYYKYYSLEQSDSINLRNNLNLDRILIIGDYHIPQCIRYRIDQKVEQLESQGKHVTTIDWMELEQNQNEIALHDIVIFYRVPAIPSILKAMAQVNANGKASFFEIDDLLFDPIYPAPIETYGGYVDITTHIELRKSVASFYSAAKHCQFGIASTKLLQEKLSDLVQSNICLLHRNGLDKLNYFPEKATPNKNTIDIFYGSGTQAHNSDFIEQALPAIETVLGENNKARLVIAGYLELPQSFKQAFKDQLVMIPPVKSVRAYWNLLEQADINLAILNDDVINGCKSELKWFEAACLNVPSIVSTTSNYRDVINNGEDALMVSSVDEWTEALRELVNNPTLRENLATKALLHVKAEYSVEALGQKLVENIEDGILSCSSKSDKRAKKKVAIVNVFFPPQAIGGATRVVTDNIDVLRKQYSDDFELVVFTSDNHCTTPYKLSCYQYEGIPVYRSTILYRENMDWHPKDHNMYNLFERFLEAEQPDLVHFHCVQRLTASVVEATKDANIPYIVTAHDAWWISDHQFLVDDKGTVYPDGHPDMYEPRCLPNNVSMSESIERIIYYRELLGSAQNILTVSEGFAEIYRKNGYPQTTVNKNGISSTVKWSPKKTEQTDKVVCAHIGSMATHKGYYLLKDVIEELQPTNIEMLIVDHSKPEGYEQTELWGNVPVTFIGRISQSGITELYQRMDVLFAPSLWPESFGLVTREAAACGCWVVASELGGMGEDVIDGETGLRIKPDFKHLSTAVKEIDSNANKYKQKIDQPDIRMVNKQVEELVGIYK